MCIFFLFEFVVGINERIYACGWVGLVLEYVLH